MTNLSVEEQNGVLVVDSRLVALELGINHGDWFTNVILKYQQELESDFGVFRFENGKPLKSSKGGRPERFVWLTEAQATVLMTYSRNTEQVRNCKRQLVKAFNRAKALISKITPAQAQENNLELEIKKLELELMNAKKSYLETSQAILASTSPAMLAFLRGDGPLPTKIEYRDRYVDPSTGQEVGSSEGRSLTQLLTDAGLNPKSTSDRTKVKNILKSHGLDYDTKENWGTASYLREYPVLPEDVYQQALSIVITELTAHSQPNLFVHQFQQTCLPPGKEKPKLSN